MVTINVRISDSAHKVIRTLKGNDRKVTVAEIVEQALLAFGGATPTPEVKAAPEPSSAEQRPSKGPGIGIAPTPEEDHTDLFDQLEGV